MLFSNGLRRSFGAPNGFRLYASISTRRGLHHDGRNRLSNFWTPTQAKKKTETGEEDGHDLLIRAGYLRQAHSGIFHLLPLGLRVQDKIERLIDKHMLSLGASKVSLSSLTSEELWQRSGRLEGGRGSEFFRLQDRRDAKYLLSPTHEEEITTIVANAVHSYKDLPLRLYQVSRKYRDEARPRQGLLRGREFLMKDLYTFDVTDEQAQETYDDVRKAYSAFLDELKLPYLVANANSGNMGGNLSHEYHFASDNGEDTIVSCDTCDYSINDELDFGHHRKPTTAPLVDSSLHYAINKDRTQLLHIEIPKDAPLNLRVISTLFPDLDMDVDDMIGDWIKPGPNKKGTRTRIVLRDPRLAHRSDDDPDTDAAARLPRGFIAPRLVMRDIVLKPEINGQPVYLSEAQTGDPCPTCSNGTLTLSKAVEIGHTFHLSTRYSEPLALRVLDSQNKLNPVSMGCHGIGISRLIGAIASLLADPKGLNWPLAVAPFGALLVSTTGTAAEDVQKLYDELSASGMDAVIDDRERPVGWKLKDADLVGYPFIVVLGKGWAERREVEVQCRRLGVKEEIPVEEVVGRMAEYRARL